MQKTVGFVSKTDHMKGSVIKYRKETAYRKNSRVGKNSDENRLHKHSHGPEMPGTLKIKIQPQMEKIRGKKGLP